MSADNADFIITFINHSDVLVCKNGGMSQMEDMQDATVNTFANFVALYSLFTKSKRFDTAAAAGEYLSANPTSYTEYGVCRIELPFHLDDPVDLESLKCVSDTILSVMDDLDTLAWDAPSADKILTKVESIVYGY